MSITDALRIAGEYELSDEEFYALEDWINAHKDGLEWPMKNGLLKLFNAEVHRRVSRRPST